MFWILPTCIAAYLALRCWDLQGRIDRYRKRETAIEDSIRCFARQRYRSPHDFVQTLKGILFNG